jgi:cation transport ATPase
LADKISGVFVYFVIFISLFTYIIWLVLGIFNLYPEEWRNGMNNIVFALIFSSSTVVIACPCSLGII